MYRRLRVALGTQNQARNARHTNGAIDATFLSTPVPDALEDVPRHAVSHRMVYYVQVTIRIRTTSGMLYRTFWPSTSLNLFDRSSAADICNFSLVRRLGKPDT